MPYLHFARLQMERELNAFVMRSGIGMPYLRFALETGAGIATR